MIQLNERVYERVKAEYYEQISRIIRSKYESLSSDEQNVLNPFTNDKMKNMFLIDDEIDSSFFEELILSKISLEKLSNKYFINYLKSAYLTTFKGFKVDVYLVRLGKKTDSRNRYKIRKEIVEIYNNNWISSIIDKHEQYYLNAENFKELINEIENNLDKVNLWLSKFIDYKFLDAKLRHKIISSTGISVCPYCNRQYISKYEVEGSEKTTADLDHFYPKKKFQLFSLSIYNFIPACQICNQRFKKTKINNLLYPFEEGFNDYARFFRDFTRLESNYLTLIGLDEHYDLNISLPTDIGKRVKIQNNIEVFKIKELYENNKRDVNLLINRKYIYSDEYISMLQEKFGFLENVSIDEFLYGYDFGDDDNLDRPLSKLIHDIYGN